METVDKKDITQELAKQVLEWFLDWDKEWMQGKTVTVRDAHLAAFLMFHRKELEELAKSGTGTTHRGRGVFESIP